MPDDGLTLVDVALAAFIEATLWGWYLACAWVAVSFIVGAVSLIMRIMRH